MFSIRIPKGRVDVCYSWDFMEDFQGKWNEGSKIQQRENKISQIETKTGIKPRSLTLKADSLPAEPQGRPKNSRVGSY